MTGLRQRHPREKAEKHLVFIRSLPCVVTGAFGVEAAHVRFGSIPHGKRATGAGEKPSDRWTVPLSPVEHRRQHDGSEAAYWRAQGIDPLVICALLWSATGDEDAGRDICANARQLVLWHKGR